MLFAAVIVCLMGIMYQANTSSSFYPGALDGVTAVVMIDIIAAIVYYLTVLVSEIVILYNEDGNRKNLEKAAARQRKGDASPSKDKSSPREGLGRLVDDSGEINTGRIETATNPLFLSQAAGGAPAAASSFGGEGASSVFSQRTAPPPETWSLIVMEHNAVVQQLAAAKSQLAEARKDASMRSSGAAAAEETADDGRAALKSAKKNFAPSAAGGSASAAVALKKAGSKRAALAL